MLGTQITCVTLHLHGPIAYLHLPPYTCSGWPSFQDVFRLDVDAPSTSTHPPIVRLSEDLAWLYDPLLITALTYSTPLMPNSTHPISAMYDRLLCLITTQLQKADWNLYSVKTMGGFVGAWRMASDVRDILMADLSLSVRDEVRSYAHLLAVSMAASLDVDYRF